MNHLLTILALFLCFSFALSPMSQSIDPQAKIKQGQLLLDNPTENPMAIEIKAAERVQKPDGTEEMPDTSELMVYPPQLIVPPKEKRTIRIQWTGQTPKSEKAFRIIAEQLPLEVEEKKTKKTGIKMLLKYIAAFYVTPVDSQAKVEIESIQAGEKLMVNVVNTGTKHQLLQNAVLTLKNDKQSLRLEGEALKGLIGENILAGSKRIFQIPLPKNFSQDMKGSLKFD
jgi:fimbrial chaperone protein